MQVWLEYEDGANAWLYLEVPYLNSNALSEIIQILDVSWIQWLHICGQYSKTIVWRKDPRIENASSLVVSIKKHKIYITLGEQHDAFCHELTQINLLIRYHNWQLCANKNKGKNSRHTYEMKIVLISGCRLQNSSGFEFLEMILIKTLSCRVRVVFFIKLWTTVSRVFLIFAI